MLLIESNAVVEQRIIIGKKELINLHKGIDAEYAREERETDGHETFMPVLCQIINDILNQQEVKQ